jgi:AcrR family transcriptional regulator
MNERLTREESQEQTRQRLIAAACKQVAERGFASTSVRDIAREAGYTQGAFYSNFKSKEDLLLDLLRQHKTQEAEHITAAIATAGDDFGKAFAALEDWARDFGMDASQALLATELQLHAARHPEFGQAYAALMAEQRQIYAQLLERLFALASHAPPVPPQELAGSLMALARSQAIDHALYGAASAGAVLLTVLRGVFARPAAQPSA